MYKGDSRKSLKNCHFFVQKILSSYYKIRRIFDPRKNDKIHLVFHQGPEIFIMDFLHSFADENASHIFLSVSEIKTFKITFCVWCFFSKLRKYLAFFSPSLTNFVLERIFAHCAFLSYELFSWFSKSRCLFISIVCSYPLLYGLYFQFWPFLVQFAISAVYVFGVR